MPQNKIKIGLDYHGVIDTNPQYFAEFCSLARHQGILIYIITGGQGLQIRQYLQDIKLEYDFIFSVLDYCYALGKTTQDAQGNIRINDEDWNKAKAEFCCQNNITLHIDDSNIYQEYFTTCYCLFDKQKNNCQIFKNIKIPFSDNPQDGLAQIISLLNKL